MSHADYADYADSNFRNKDLRIVGTRISGFQDYRGFDFFTYIKQRSLLACLKSACIAAIL